MLLGRSRRGARRLQATTAGARTSPGSTWTSTAQDLAYQPFQSVMSFGSGGALGLGLGRGLQVLYLPEAHTDFIAAIIGEELGFLGDPRALRGVPGASSRAACSVALCAPGRLRQLPRVRHLDDVRRAGAREPRGRDGHPADQGLTLPFVSYGGSSLLVNAVGGRDPAQHLAAATRRAAPPIVSERVDAPEASAGGGRPRPRRARHEARRARGTPGDPHRRRRNRRARVPVVAVADALRELADVRVVYVGTARGIEARVVPERGDELELLDVRPIKGRRHCRVPSAGMANAAATLPRARARSCDASRRARSFRVGGYAGRPGRARGGACSACPLALLEPNSTLGLANRLLAAVRAARLRRVPRGRAQDAARHRASHGRAAPRRASGRAATQPQAGRVPGARARREPGRRRR